MRRSQFRPTWTKKKKLVRPYLKEQVGVVAHTVNPSHMRGVARRIEVLGQLGQKHETPSEGEKKKK
jgi:hypothetical protein